MKAVETMNPAGSELTPDVLTVFDEHLQRLFRDIEKGNAYPLDRMKVGVVFSRMIKIRMVDAMRFVVAHNQRHLEQAQRATEVARGKHLT